MTRIAATLVALAAAVACAPADPLTTPDFERRLDAAPPEPPTNRGSAGPSRPDAAPGEPEPPTPDPPAGDPPWVRVPLTVEVFDDPGPLSDCLPPADWPTPGAPDRGESPIPPEGDGDGAAPDDRPPPPLPPEPWSCVSAYQHGLSQPEAVFHAGSTTPVMLGHRLTYDLGGVTVDRFEVASPARLVGPVEWRLLEAPAGGAAVPEAGGEGDAAAVWRPEVPGRYVLAFEVDTEAGPVSGQCALDAVADPELRIQAVTGSIVPSDIAFGLVPTTALSARLPFLVVRDAIEMVGDGPVPISGYSGGLGGLSATVSWSVDDRSWTARPGDRLRMRIPVRWSTEPIDRWLESDLDVLDEDTAPGPRIERARMACHQGRPALHVRLAEPDDRAVLWMTRAHLGWQPASDEGDILIAGLRFDPRDGEAPLLIRALSGFAFADDVWPHRGPAVPVELPAE